LIYDSEIGYRNKPNYRHWAFGRIDGSTNASGFRTRMNLPLKAKKGVIRIIGIGDSVMEGAQVNAQDAFLGILEHIIKAKGVSIETINAGICGYSSYQERLFFEQYVVPFHPDIVLVNFSPNDLLPTEDPFGNARTIYLRYLEKLLREQRYQFSESEQALIKDTIVFLQTASRVWNIVEEFDKDPIKKRTLERIFIEIPILEMKGIADKNRIKFVYVFIYEGNEQLKDFMKSAGINYVDCSPLLLESPVRTQPLISSYLSTLAVNFDKYLYTQRKVTFFSFKRYNPVYALVQIAKLNTFRYKHSHQFWIDDVGHPSYEGNAVIAQAIYEHLKQEDMLP
jgi:lysophospholipase L1-like esterase